MVWHHMSFQYLYSLVLAQSSDYFLQVCSILIVYDLPSVFRNEHYVVLAHPFRMCQTACLVCHKISVHCSNRLDILFYHVWRFFGITFVSHPHSGWLSVSHFVLNLPKGVNHNHPSNGWFAQGLKAQSYRPATQVAGFHFVQAYCLCHFCRP